MSRQNKQLKEVNETVQALKIQIEAVQQTNNKDSKKKKKTQPINREFQK